MNSQAEKEKDITFTLIAALQHMEHTPTREEVREKAKYLSDVFNFQGSLDAVIEEALVIVDTHMGSGISLVNMDADHDEKWVFERDISAVYSDSYKKFLKKEKWSPLVIQSLSDVSRKILGQLQNPESEGNWDRRGLVMGHVQSGKTANYIGLISHAADAGYKFFVVVAGIHNVLRRQTQERIDEGFIGRSSNPDNRITIGVGKLSSNYPHPVTLTNIYSDFSKQMANQSGWSINDVSKPIVLVIKKNVRVLDSLQRWLKELNSKGDGKISDIPMLMIDDESDYASINTNIEEIDPTRTNALLRKILGMFDKSCYIGYTATPFANIFINPDGYDYEVREELFPRDFIYCLDAPTTYLGPEKIFLNEEISRKTLDVIGDAEDYIPISHKRDFKICEIPPSLYEAINQFVLIRTIRNLRGQKNKHCSMMVNVSRFMDIQSQVRNFISIYIENLKNAVKANYAMPIQSSGKNKYMFELQRIFKMEFDNCGFSWTTIKTSLFGAFEHLRIYLINSTSEDKLDFKSYENDGLGLTAIAIGGLSLSRGLTIEGLSVSYMYRNTRMYDTLMQMGRWFGYRPNYGDLCRVHLTEDSINWYAHISEASEELREQIGQMRRDGLSPRDFGLYVRDHPDTLFVTAMNKMRTGKKLEVNLNFSGRIRESYILPIDEKINAGNRNLIKNYWKSGFGQGFENLVVNNKGWHIIDVSSQIIEEFLRSFHVHSDFYEHHLAHIEYLETISKEYPTCDVLLISLNSHQNSNSFELGAQKRNSAAIEFGRWRLKKDRVASKGDEKIGLTEEQLNKAKRLLDDSNKQPSDVHYRKVRNKTLLMIHFLDLGREGDSKYFNIPAYGISFPLSNSSKSIKFIVNKVWMERVHGSVSDIEDEEDYDR